MVLNRIVAVSRESEIQQLARRIGREVFAADNIAEAFDIIRTADPDLIIIDTNIGLCDVRQFLDIHLTQNKNPENVPVVIVACGQTGTDSSEEFIRVGACDYINGPQDYHRLELIAAQIKNKSQTETENSGKNLKDFFAEDCAAAASIVGLSKAILNNLKMIKLVAASRCNPVLIVGETGTGKELAARAIHNLRHQNEPFVAVNCAALTANLLESELFGHAKGSFTSADSEKTGLMELAGSGTIFLDEISEMPIDLQAKILRVLQEKTFRKVGGIKNIPCNSTIIASSNRNLQKEAQANRFRLDLYYRLNICPVVIPPLRAHDRRDDIPILAQYFLRTSTLCPDKKGKITSLTKLALEALQKHDWPGNVRELRNVIERAILLETTEKIGLGSILINPADCNELAAAPSAGHVREFSLAKAEQQLIGRALKETGWQKTHAAALLGITRATLYAKVKQYNIKKNSNSDPTDELTEAENESQTEEFSSFSPEPAEVI